VGAAAVPGDGDLEDLLRDPIPNESPSAVAD
jgi:hypothetical protein